MAIAEADQEIVTRLSLPPLAEIDGVPTPEAPTELGPSDVDPQVLRDLVLKFASTVTNFTTEWIVKRVCLPVQVVEDFLWQLKQDQLVEVLGQEGPFSYRYAATQRGRTQADRLLEVSGYIGPAPVSIESYTAFLNWQVARHSRPTLESVQQALADLVLPEEVVEVAALATSSGRSLFLFGPAGNGKSSLGRALHDVLVGELWIPHAICVDHSIIRLFDPQCHEVVETDEEFHKGVDQRWVRIRRPHIVAGGEMTIEELDLAWVPSRRFYEAPLHVKANGGMFLIDDLGRQRVAPRDLLNRWIVPLEHRIDYLALNSGQKIQLPFELMLLVATNLTVSEVADPAFLRRMGYRLQMKSPSAAEFMEIFDRYARHVQMEIAPGLAQTIIERYQTEGRDLRASEPRDLIERARDTCRYRGLPHSLTPEVLEVAWRGYFGNQ